MAKTILKEKVQALRKQGLSIKEISEKTGAVKSSVSYWCKDIILTTKQIERLQLKQKTSGLKTITQYTEKLRRDRIIRIKNLTVLGKNDIQQIDDNILLYIGLGLYWAEGYKKGNNEFGFTNSDPYIIKLICKWLMNIYKVSKDDFILRVSINKIHSYRIDAVLKYWSNLIGVPLTQFTKTSLINSFSKKIYSNHNDHHGTLRIKIRRGSNLKLRILGSIQKINELTS